MTPGTLYVVGMPLGNARDVTLRAMDVLKSADVVCCEERKIAGALLHRLGIEKPLIEINEHTETKEAPIIVGELRGGKSFALISDCGMPVFADPGKTLITLARKAAIPIVIVPGPDSLTSAFALAGADARRFFYYGFLSAKKEERRRELTALRRFPHTLVFMDAPYRLLAVLTDLTGVFGDGRSAIIACDLTQETEELHQGTLGTLCKRFAADKRKREFVIIVQPPASRIPKKNRRSGKPAPPDKRKPSGSSNPR